MSMSRLLILLVLCGVTARAAETPTYTEVEITNAFARVVISTQRASLSRFEVLDAHPVVLPKHLTQDPGAVGGPGKDGKPALVVLGAANLPVEQAVGIHSADNQHNWLVNDRPGVTVYGLEGNDVAPWTVVRKDATSATLAFAPGRGLTYQLTYTMDPQRPTVRVMLTVLNSGSSDATLNPALVPINGIHQDYYHGEQGFTEVADHRNGSLSAHTITLPMTQAFAGGADYIALKSRFFAAFWTPGKVAVESTVPVVSAVVEAVAGPGVGGPGTAAAIGPVVPNGGWRATAIAFENRALKAHQAWVQVNWDAAVVKPGAQLVQEWSLTATCLRKADLDRLDESERRIEFTSAFYKFFQSITKILAWVLDHIAALVHNYGVAVLLLTLLIKAAMLKLTFKQHGSMIKMQKLAPELKSLQNQYADNKQVLAQKQMELWKKHSVNPLGGCLPMFIQIPIFIALYQAFQFSADMRGGSFLWVHDLTLPDQVWGMPLAFLGGWVLSLNPLPIIYIIATIFMSLSQPLPTGGDPQQEQMAKMMRWLPVIFGVIFYNMPAGLVLYFTANAIISTIEVKWVRWKLGVK